MSNKPQRAIVLFGTRPEVIKLAPVVRALKDRPQQFDCRVVSSGQHREMVDQAVGAFGLQIDVQLDAMSSARSLGQLTARLFGDLDRLLEAEDPDWILVQGDTSSAMVGAMCGFYHRVKIAHVEAGLRTYDRWSPFPEEINRTIIGHVADLHFAPTARSRENLIHGGAAASTVHVTGNTVVDALHWVAEMVRNAPPAELASALGDLIDQKRLVLVTCHRREAFGAGLESICRALLEIVRRHQDVVIVYPVHLNPSVCLPVHRLLSGETRIRLLSPLGYREMIYLMQRSYCILTDSGGIQEEAPSLGKPVLIMRETTERPEVVDAGCARLVGVSAQQIGAAADELLSDASLYRSMAQVPNPFGDGRAAERIAEILWAQ